MKSTPTILFFVLFLLAISTTCILAQISPDKHFRDVISTGYNFSESALTNPTRFYEHQHASKILGITSNTPNLNLVCKEIQGIIDLKLTIAANAQTYVVMQQLHKILTLFPCKTLTLPQSVIDLTDTMVLSDLLVEVNAGSLFYFKLNELGYKSYGLDRHDWSDIVDLLTALYLSDGLSRSSVSTLAPTVRNTILIIETLATIMPHVQPNVALQHFTSTSLTIQALAKSHLCTSSFTIQDYSDFITYSTILYSDLKSTQVINAPLQCVTSKIQQSLLSTEFISISSTLQILQQIVNLNTKIFNITDAIVPSKLFFISAPHSATPDTSNKSVNISFTFSQITSVSPVIFTPISKFSSPPSQPQLTITITPPATTTSIGSKTVNTADILSPISISLNTIASNAIYAVQHVAIKAATQTVSTARISFSKPSAPIKPTKDEQVLFVLNNDSKKATKLSPTNKPISLDLSTARQLEFKITTPQSTLASIRFFACPFEITKECLTINSTPLQKSMHSVVSYFSSESSKSTEFSAFFYLTSPEMKALIKPQANYIAYFETVNLSTRIATTQVLSIFTSTITDEALYNISFPQQHNDNKSYLWRLITEHIHTFKMPRPFANPLITSIAIVLTLAVTAIFAIYLLTIFKPSPNFSTALGSLNALFFTISIGIMLAGIVSYWFYFTLFQVLLPAALLIVPCSLAIYFPLRESVSSTRLYNLLYTQFATTKAVIKDKKD